MAKASTVKGKGAVPPAGKAKAGKAPGKGGGPKPPSGTLRAGGAAVRSRKAPGPPARGTPPKATGKRLKVGKSDIKARIPGKPLLRAQLTPSLTLGPYYFRELLRPGEEDLTILSPGRPRAIGDVIEVTGKVLDEDGKPVRHALIEIWQANAYGRYRHPLESYDAPLDPNFLGVGRCLTDENGVYRFVTVKPGPYPVQRLPGWWRPPVIHMSILALGLVRLVTQMFFPNETLNRFDLILNDIPDPKDRKRLIARPIRASPKAPPGAAGFEFDIVLRGKAETPFFDDDY